MSDDQSGSITGEMSRISIFTFFAVAEQLALSEAEQRCFLEHPDDAEFADWRDNGAGTFGPVLFMKINALVKLSSSLNRRFDHDTALRWLRTPNTAPLFHGKPPAEIIACADLGALERIRVSLEQRAADS